MGVHRVFPNPNYRIDIGLLLSRTYGPPESSVAMTTSKTTAFVRLGGPRHKKKV